MNLGKIVGLYGRFERPISSFSLIGGFLFDILTLERIDRVWDNFWVLAHIIVVAVFMVLVHSVDSNEGDEANPYKSQFWYVNILQFFFGGLLSVFLVFYFRSSDLLVSWPFLALLAIAFWANESMKRSFTRLTFQVSLFFLSLFSCAIFFIPVLVHQIGSTVFFASGLVSLVLIFIFLNIVAKVNKQKFLKSFKSMVLSIISIYCAINLLYFTNLIPPIPLSLKDYGIYNSIYKNKNSEYIALYEDLKPSFFYKLYDDVTVVVGDPVYAFSAVFSPTNLDTTIVHQWQYYDPMYKKWIDTNRIELKVVGGRESGFRTYSVKLDIFPGKWRVKVETKGGQTIGTLRFNIKQSQESPALVSKILE